MYATDEMQYVKFDTSDDVYCVWASGISYQSFVDYVSTAFTQDYINRLQQPHTDYESTPLIVNINDQLYSCADTERGVAPNYDSTIYYVQTQTENKVTIVRDTIVEDIYHLPDEPEYSGRQHTYYYMDLVKTPDGWRFDDFPMYDDFSNDVKIDGTLAYPPLY